MRTFTDNTGRTWTLSLTLDAAKRVKGLLGVNLLELDRALGADPAAETSAKPEPLLTRLGTHQGAISPQHLDYYLDEYTFRYNRRRSQARGMLFYRLLEQATQVDPASGRREDAPRPQQVGPTRAKWIPTFLHWRAAGEGRPPASLAREGIIPSGRG